MTETDKEKKERRLKEIRMGMEVMYRIRLRSVGINIPEDLSIPVVLTKEDKEKLKIHNLNLIKEKNKFRKQIIDQINRSGIFNADISNENEETK